VIFPAVLCLLPVGGLGSRPGWWAIDLLLGKQ
jgi:hypothetical protein